MMRRPRLPLIAAPPVLLLALLLTPPAPLPAADAPAERTLAGQYRSNFGNGPVEATFTPDGEGAWKVRFDFVFNNRDHTYEGTARGSIGEGSLEGRVTNEYGRRTFTFRGEFEDGEYRASHAEVVRGRDRRTGTMVLQE